MMFFYFIPFASYHILAFDTDKSFIPNLCKPFHYHSKDRELIDDKDAHPAYWWHGLNR